MIFYRKPSPTTITKNARPVSWENCNIIINWTPFFAGSGREFRQDDGQRSEAEALQLDVPKPPMRRLSRSTMSLKIAPDVPAKPPQLQFFPSTPTAAVGLTIPMTPTTDPTIPNGFSPQLYQAYTSNKATDFFFKQLDGKYSTVHDCSNVTR